MPNAPGSCTQGGQQFLDGHLEVVGGCSAQPPRTSLQDSPLQQSLLIQYLYLTGVLQLVPWVLASKKSHLQQSTVVFGALSDTQPYFLN